MTTYRAAAGFDFIPSPGIMAVNGQMIPAFEELSTATPAVNTLTYMPMDGTTSSNATITADSVRRFFTRPGQLLGIVLCAGTAATGLTTLGFHLNNNVVPVTTVVVDVTATDTRFFYDFSASNALWALTDSVHIGITSVGGPSSIRLAMLLALDFS